VLVANTKPPLTGGFVVPATVLLESGRRRPASTEVGQKSFSNILANLIFDHHDQGLFAQAVRLIR
jgi:hypothetical protein